MDGWGNLLECCRSSLDGKMISRDDIHQFEFFMQLYFMPVSIIY